MVSASFWHAIGTRILFRLRNGAKELLAEICVSDQSLVEVELDNIGKPGQLNIFRARLDPIVHTGLRREFSVSDIHEA